MHVLFKLIEFSKVFCDVSMKLEFYSSCYCLECCTSTSSQHPE